MTSRPFSMWDKVYMPCVFILYILTTGHTSNKVNGVWDSFGLYACNGVTHKAAILLMIAALCFIPYNVCWALK